jgi:hypothetical protein
MLSILLSLAIAPRASAQAVSTASIAGTVHDESGGLRPGVTVTSTAIEPRILQVALEDLFSWHNTSEPS